MTYTNSSPLHFYLLSVNRHVNSRNENSKTTMKYKILPHPERSVFGHIIC